MSCSKFSPHYPLFVLDIEKGPVVDNDDFGDFAAFRSASPPQNNTTEENVFTAFQSNALIQPQQVMLSDMLINSFSCQCCFQFVSKVYYPIFQTLWVLVGPGRPEWTNLFVQVTCKLMIEKTIPNLSLFLTYYICPLVQYC